MKYTSTNQIYQSRYEISYADFLRELTEGDTIIPANRKSSRSQDEASHNAKEMLLRALYNDWNQKAPFEMCPFDGSGKLCHINDQDGYFVDLRQTIQDGLARTPADKKVYMIFTSRSRLFRPPNYDRNNQSATWHHCAADYDTFDQWIRDNFGARADDVQFVILFHWLTPGEERSFETQLGQFYKRCLDGIGKRLGRKASRMLRPIVVELRRRQKLSTPEIECRLKLEYPDEKLPAAKTLRKWLFEEGLSEPRGRRWHKTT